MSKKHFIRLADYIRAHNVNFSEAPFTERQIDWLAMWCSSENSAFMEGRWKDYIAGLCGPNGGQGKEREKYAMAVRNFDAYVSVLARSKQPATPNRKDRMK